MPTDADVVILLKKILGKFRKVEGIYIFPRTETLLNEKYVVTTEGIETEVIDLTDKAKTLIFIVNQQDTSINVNINMSYAPEGVYATIRSVQVDPGETKILISTRTIMPYLKITAKATDNPTTGNTTIVVCSLSL